MTFEEMQELAEDQLLQLTQLPDGHFEIWDDELQSVEFVSNDMEEIEAWLVQDVEDFENDGFMSDAEADADVFRSCGWGTDEDYGSYGDDEW